MTLLACGLGALGFSRGPDAHRTSPFTSYDEVAFLLMMFGPLVILAGAGLATFVRATDRPRYYWPFIGIATLVGLVVTSHELASW